MSGATVTTGNDPLGQLTRVVLDLPCPEPNHYAPIDELVAMADAGESATACDFIDDPTNDLTTWPLADRQFLVARAGSSLTGIESSSASVGHKQHGTSSGV